MSEMLTIAQAVEKIKQLHPDTHIGQSTIRTWQKQNKFKSVKIGRKILISWNSLCKFLNG